MLGAGGGHWLSNNEGRVVRVGNNGKIVTKVDRARFGEQLMMIVLQSVQRSAKMLGASGGCWQPNNEDRVVRVGNNGSIVTKVG